MLTDAMPALSNEIIEKLLERRALLRGNSVDGFEVDENWNNVVEKDPGKT